MTKAPTPLVLLLMGAMACSDPGGHGSVVADAAIDGAADTAGPGVDGSADAATQDVSTDTAAVPDIIEVSGDTTDGAPQTDATDPTPDLLHIIELGQVSHSDGSGMTDVLTVDVPDDAISLHIVAEGASGVMYVLGRLTAPDGQALVPAGWYVNPANQAGPQMCLICPLRIIAAETAFAALIPNTPEIALKAGTYRLQIFGFQLQAGSMFEPPTTVPQAGEVSVTIVIKRRAQGPQTTGALDLNLMFSGADGLNASGAPADDRVQEAITEMARLAAELNRRMENIGARRLQTIMAQLLDELLFVVPESRTGKVVIDRAFVTERLDGIIRDEDLSRYIL